MLRTLHKAERVRLVRVSSLILTLSISLPFLSIWLQESSSRSRFKLVMDLWFVELKEVSWFSFILGRLQETVPEIARGHT